MDDLLIQMGERLASRRSQLRLSQAALAEKADLTTQTVSTAETGKKALRPENIIKLCLALDISADYLLFGKVSSMDMDIMSAKVSLLTPEQYRILEDIINSYVTAVTLGKSQNDSANG